MIVSDIYDGIFRNCIPKVFCKKVVLEKFTKFTREHLCQSLLCNNVPGLGLELYLKRGSGTGVFL